MKIRWGRWISGFFFFLVVIVGISAILAATFLQQWARDALIRGIEQRTGGRVELGKLTIRPWRLEAEIDNLTLHGLENAASPPLFHAAHVEVGIHILSFFGKRIAIDRLVVDQPETFVTIDKNGHSNVPTPPHRTSGAPWQTTLFNLQIAQLELNNGSATVNARSVPLTVRGQNFQFLMNYYAAANQPNLYVGKFDWEKVQWVQGKTKPIPFDVSTKFTLHRDSFELDELVCKLPHSEFDVRAELPSFALADWNLRYRGRFLLADVRPFSNAPLPEASTEFSGEAHYQGELPADDQWKASGYFRTTRIRFPYQWFHANGMETAGNYELAHQHIKVANLSAKALSGTLSGNLDLNVRTLDFHTETHLHGASLAAALDAVNNPQLPVNPLHWDAAMDVDSINTWQANFKHFRSAGKSSWTPPQPLAAKLIPVTAHIDYDYSQDLQSISIMESQIATPEAEVDMDGPLGGRDSGLEVQFQTSDLLRWDDFINVLRGPGAKPEPVTGGVIWRGRILGPIVGPTFVGYMEATDPTYANLYWNRITGDMVYSPDQFSLSNTVVTRGRTAAKMNLNLQFDGNWGFVPESTWLLDGEVQNAPSEDFQAMFGTNYPVSGYISGNFHGSGTHAAPKLDSDFTFDQVQAKGVRFDQLKGHLILEPDKVDLSQAELSRGAGRVTGSLSYRPQERDATFDLNGKAISLENVTEVQTPAMPVGGTLNFNLKGSGPIRAPAAQGDLEVANLKLGSEIEGNFAGHLMSDGSNAKLTLASELARGKLQGELTMGFSGDEPISGQLTVQSFDLDPFLVSALHLKQPTKHSSADGVFKVSGELKKPDTLAVEADITQIAFDYEFVQLTNDQDIRITYHRNEVRIEQARLHGPDTDMVLSGTARFDGERPLRLNLSGSVNLRLAKGLLPDLDAQGRAEASVSVGGTMSHPSITGRTTVTDASATYADFPIVLSKVNGTLVFDKSRLVFDQITAQAGGGNLNLNGSLSYDENPVRFEVTATTSTLRIRYPAGMSWLASGTIQLSGSSEGAVVSGNVQVQRMLFGQGVDVASFFAAASETTSQQVSTSPFLQNLTFDVAGQTAPGARIEWSGAEVEMDANVRLRGTWDRPVILGNIHLLNGEMPFRGNTYTLTRGDINFANPFRLDPVLNVEATSTISQYQVTIDFSGTASHLAMNYRSDPPLPETDIIGLLALGRTGEEANPVSQSASQNYGATALLSEAISSGLGGRIEHLFGISQFRVDPFVAGTATESNAAARVTIQEQIRRDLVITYSSNAATSNQYQLIQVEYHVKRDLSVVFLRDINGTYGMDIKWVKRLK